MARETAGKLKRIGYSQVREIVFQEGENPIVIGCLEVRKRRTQK